MLANGEAQHGRRRVHQIITCPLFEGREYDENVHMGYAAESLVGEVLERAATGARPLTA